jgi:adenylate cyclase
MPDKPQFFRDGIKVGVIFLVFLLFLAHAAGLFDIQITQAPGISFGKLWSATADGWQSPALQRVFHSGEFVLFISTGLLLSIALPLLNPVPASLLTLLAIVPPVYSNYAGLVASPLIPMEYHLLTILMLFIVNVLIGYFEESHEKQKIIDTFRHYVPPQIVSEICRNPEHISLDGESRDMTVMFTDLKDFAGIAEQVNPKQLAKLLNEYFTAMTEILYSHGATIDKFMGDSIMAFWGAPLPQSDHAERAVKAAFDMHREIELLAGRYKQRDWPWPEMYIGINTGLMNVGNMGSEYRMTYTVIGDSVNVASRLEHLTRVYQVNTIVSETTMAAVESCLFRTLDRVQLRGKHTKVRIYQPVCDKSSAGPELIEFLNRHEYAINMMFAGNKDEAIKAFQELRAERPGDAYYEKILQKLSAPVMESLSRPAPQAG